MSNIAIKAENLSKAYQLGEFSTGTISRDIERWWAKLRGKEDPFLKIGETNDRTSKGQSDIVWSLKDINFEINQGDAVGIIGRNGAGKSTLLKVLSRVTSPSTGSIKVKGRIASLLEVGTGFHPELTGRENIFLNGAILGMRKSEIKKHFDAIVDFAGVERYIDTPVKRYSSGMYVRLAFAVAAHLESETLIVDEVLAVGDAEFQKKCLGKMGQVSKGEGRTVLFVSHNMEAVKSLCTSAIWIQNGNIAGYGGTENIISNYIDKYITTSSSWVRTSEHNPSASFISAHIEDFYGNIVNTINSLTDFYIVIETIIHNHNFDGTFAFEVLDKNETSIFCSHDHDISPTSYSAGRIRHKIKLPNFLRNGQYFVNLGSNSQGFGLIEFVGNTFSFNVLNSANTMSSGRPGVVWSNLKWESKQL